MNRKLIKLIKSPRLFFSDMLKKKLAKGIIPIQYVPWLKYRGQSKYSVVCAVYGVEKYLEQFFLSIFNQSLDFTQYIELIMVDDGSLDGSADIIKKWARKYPQNIKYIKKENGGQASARNLGMKHVSHDWVTFIDPDDFLGSNYFAEVDKVISEQENLVMVSCNFIFYFEDKDRFSDTHPLKYRFDKARSVFVLPDLKKHVQLSVNSAFFKKSIIESNHLEMDIRVKPNFEDAKFVGEYFLCCHGKSVAYISDAKYYYRKRQDNSSTLDGSWQKKEQFLTKLKYGDLNLLEIAKNRGDIPFYIQRIVLYDLIWYFRSIVNNTEKLSFLSENEKNQFLSNIRSIFEYINDDVIAEFELVSCSGAFKQGWLGLKYNQATPFSIDILDYDNKKKQIKLRYYFHGKSCHEAFKLDNKEVFPDYKKIRIHDFLGNIFCNERILWLPATPDKQLSATINNQSVHFNLDSKDESLGEKISINEIHQYFESPKINEKDFSPNIRSLRFLARLSANLPDYQNAWVFMDRDVQADDNAEHLYRYIKEQKLNLNIRFILRKSSHDWKRLKNEGFRLVPFGSIRHMIILFNAKHLISSHADNYVINYPPHSWFKGILSYKYSFLQHGVIQNDLSNWLNNKPINLFVTASEREYQSIAGEENTYKFTDKEVCLTGLARHDALLLKVQSIQNHKELRKTLLIMPTWRQNLVGKTEFMSTNRRLSDAFYTSDYAKNWRALLHSDVFKSLVKKYNLDVIFFPHANIAPYLEWFDVPKYIKSYKHDARRSIQDLFVEASILLTDYSSVAFEVAYLEKPVIYYQFDADEVFGGGHTTAKGYFDYNDDGFGPVCETEDKLFSNLEKILDNNCNIEDQYLNRIKNTFKFRDGKCCQRIYEAILDLDRAEK